MIRRRFIEWFELARVLNEAHYKGVPALDVKAMRVQARRQAKAYPFHSPAYYGRLMLKDWERSAPRAGL